ncbi:MAG: DUF4249 domain-containing protein [Bacteroidetes bacterium]|nr:DUF4249 domain-containing protein [Bacteroidota bacterium]
MTIRAVISILFLLSITSCVEKYWPQVDRYNHVLVVDGFLSNSNDPATVNLSYSSSINEGVFIPISDGIVYVVDNNQLTLTFTETEPGVYLSEDQSFQGQIGNSYQLFVELPNGNKYESEICWLNAPSPIDSVYGVQETREVPNRYLPQQIVQFYLDNHSDNSDTCYYMWRLNQTYKYQSSFDIDYTWEGEFKPFPVPDSMRTCWHDSQVQEIFTFTTKNLASPLIDRFPLNFCSTDTKELSIRYSLLVSQLSISKEAFDFWDAMRQQNVDMENLHSRQPFQLRGNIKNIENAEETVLGYFTVAGVTKKRIYVNRPALPFYYMICEPDYGSMGWIQFEPPEYWPIYLTMSNSGALGMATLYECFDCQLEGGSLRPPDFWEN